MSLRVVILTLMVIGCGATAYYLLAAKPQTVHTAEVKLLRGLTDDAASISQITIEDAQGTRFSARLMAGQWLATHLAEEQTFPVDQARLKTLVTQVTQARVTERKTANPDYYARLGVASPDSGEPDANLITITTATARYSLHVGKPSAHSDGQFVREKEASRVLLINRTITLPRSPTDWLEPRILPFSVDQLATVEVTQQAQPDLVFSQQQDTQWVWQGQPDSRRLRYPGVVADTLSSMLAMDYEAVSPFRSQQWQQQTVIATLSFTLKGGETFIAQLSRDDDVGNHLLRFEETAGASWLHDWVFTLAPYQAKALLVSPDNLLMASDDAPQS